MNKYQLTFIIDGFTFKVNIEEFNIEMAIKKFYTKNKLKGVEVVKCEKI